jgi:hypothetical protein
MHLGREYCAALYIWFKSWQKFRLHIISAFFLGPFRKKNRKSPISFVNRPRVIRPKLHDRFWTNSVLQTYILRHFYTPCWFRLGHRVYLRKYFYTRNSRNPMFKRTVFHYILVSLSPFTNKQFQLNGGNVMSIFTDQRHFPFIWGTVLYGLYSTHKNHKPKVFLPRSH